MQRRTWAAVISWASMIVCTFIVITAAGFALMNQAWMAFLIPMAIVVAIACFAGRYDEKVNPRYVTFTRDLVEIDVPGKGRILVLETASV